MYSLQMATGVIFSKQTTVTKTVTLIISYEINLNVLDTVGTMIKESKKRRVFKNIKESKSTG